MKNHIVRNMLVIFVGLILLTVFASAFQLVRLTRTPGTTVALLPPSQWFSNGLVMDGANSVWITTVYGPIAITEKHPR